MSGPLQAYVMRTGHSYRVEPVACPLADRVPEEQRAGLVCARWDDDGTEITSCPYYHMLRGPHSLTADYTPWHFSLDMKEGGHRQLRAQVICLEAKPTARPGC